MDRLEDPGARLAEGRRRREADSAGGDRRDVGEDVAERVLGEQDVEPGGIADELHRRIVDEHVVERDVGVVDGHGVDDLAPELRRLEHAVLVGTVTSRLRFRASSNARRAIRSIWRGWYSHVSKAVPSSRRPFWP